MKMFKKAIVTSGSTLEWIDPVRYISNSSSGKMGFCIAHQLSKKLSTVYIYGNVNPKYSQVKGSKSYQVTNNLEMKQAILKELDDNTILIMAAAPSDFKIEKPKNQKIKKSGSLELHFQKNEDILSSISKEKKIRNLKNMTLVGFCAETENLEQNAKGKLRSKDLDFIVANYVSQNQGFGDRNTSILVFGKNQLYFSIKNATKEEIAKKLVDFFI